MKSQKCDLDVSLTQISAADSIDDRARVPGVCAGGARRHHHLLLHRVDPAGVPRPQQVQQGATHCVLFFSHVCRSSSGAATDYSILLAPFLGCIDVTHE